MATAAWFLTGPTGVGKSAVALCLAERLGAEIISVDSMQVYRGMDVGTAKPSVADRQRAPHHLIDVVAVTEPFDAAQFVRRAGQAEEAIRARGRAPLFCGGTGLYFRAYLAGLGAAPGGDAVLRAGLEELPLSALLAELEAGDPVAFARIDRQNRRRVVRAVEVLRLTGKPFSAQQAAWSATTPDPAAPAPTVYGLTRAPAELRTRLEARVEEMFRRGLVEETRGLLAQGLAGNRTACQAIGYRQVLEHLAGQRSLAQTITLVKHRTWQYAKRQMTWFRHQMAVQWLTIPPGEPPEAVADRLQAGGRLV